LSKPLIGLGQLILIATWLIDGKYKQKLISFFTNKTALALSSVYWLLWLSLIYSSNLDYGLDDVRRKFPMFLLPLLLSGFDGLTKKEFKLIFKVYVAGVLAASLWSIFVMLGGLNIQIIDKRDLSRFNSHIRFGLEICFAIFGSFYYFFKSKSNLKYFWGVIGLWFIIFLFVLNLFTGILVLFLSSILLSIFYALKSDIKWVKFSFSFLSIIIIFFIIYQSNSSINDFKKDEIITPLTIENISPNGTTYSHDTTTVRQHDKENGIYIWRNIAWQEVHSSWAKRSNMLLTNKDLKGQLLSTTLIRFLSSKGVNKNAQTIEDLTDNEVKAIERGIANYKYITLNSFERRIHKILWEFQNYKMGRDYNGHSVVMRWEYWKTAYRIFSKNVIYGVGVGDLEDAFMQQYNEQNSLLLPKFRHRAHNQYITIAVTLGLFGLLSFCVFLCYPFFKNKMYKSFFYLAFFSIFLLSMLTEDTLETQVGITFFIFFNTVLLFKQEKEV